MDADQITAVAITLMFGVPLSLLGLAAWRLSQPPEKCKPTEREQYPDDHLFI